MTFIQTSRHGIRGMAALGICLLAPIGLALAIYMSVQGMMRDADDTLQTRRETLARLQAAVDQGRRILDAPGSDSVSAFSADFLSGAQDSVVVAELQNRLRATAINNRVELNSANTLPARAVGTLSYLGLRIIMRGQVADIQQVLHSIETSAPLLFVERVTMRVDNWPIKSADPAVDGAPALIVELDVFGVKSPSTATGNAATPPQGGAPSTAAAATAAQTALPVPASVRAMAGGRRL